MKACEPQFPPLSQASNPHRLVMRIKVEKGMWTHLAQDLAKVPPPPVVFWSFRPLSEDPGRLWDLGCAAASTSPRSSHTVIKGWENALFKQVSLFSTYSLISWSCLNLLVGGESWFLAHSYISGNFCPWLTGIMGWLWHTALQGLNSPYSFPVLKGSFVPRIH